MARPGTANLWKLKKETFPKVSPSLPAVKQDINGRLISGQKKLQKLYSDVFTHRLRHRPTINEDYEELHDLQSELLQKRMMASKHVQTPDWTEDDVVKVLRSLKRGKAKDPHYMINELFMPPVAGPDLVKSVTKMMNIIKTETYLSNFGIKTSQQSGKEKDLRLNSTTSEASSHVLYSQTSCKSLFIMTLMKPSRNTCQMQI